LSPEVAAQKEADRAAINAAYERVAYEQSDFSGSSESSGSESGCSADRPVVYAHIPDNPIRTSEKVAGWLDTVQPAILPLDFAPNSKDGSLYVLESRTSVV